LPEAAARLRELHGDCEPALIGPAGERQVLFASVSSKNSRQVGRGGLGAVMGSKLLKAVVLVPPPGALRTSTADEGFDDVLKETAALLSGSPVTGEALPDFGTPVLLHVLNELGALPTRNFRESRFESAEEISGEALRADWVERRVACEGCPIGCGRHTRSRRGVTRGPEYESLWAFGADCGVANLEAIIEANDACNRFGLDTITMGASIACAMELTARNVLRDGPHFGDAAALLELISATASRQGLGDELAEGSRRFASRHGHPDLAMEAKGLELPAFDPRGMTGQGLAFATSNRGGCHLRANMLGPEVLGVPTLLDRFATHGKSDVLIYLQDTNAILDSLPLCKFAAYVLTEDHYARMLSAVMDEMVDASALRRAGERIWNLERVFNLRAGFTRADDTLPTRLLQEPIVEGPSQGHTVDLRPMLDEYYAHRGWNAEGRPSDATLEELGVPPLLSEAPRRLGPSILLDGGRAPAGRATHRTADHLTSSHGG
jgi:aldehyde:ferredoxin oxidoreductase